MKGTLRFHVRIYSGGRYRVREIYQRNSVFVAFINLESSFPGTMRAPFIANVPGNMLSFGIGSFS